MSELSDRELLELAAKSAGIEIDSWDRGSTGGGRISNIYWNPITDDGDLMRLAIKAKISIDMVDCYAWHRLPSGCLIQEFWGGDHTTDYRRAVVLVAAQIQLKREGK